MHIKHYTNKKTEDLLPLICVHTDIRVNAFVCICLFNAAAVCTVEEREHLCVSVRPIPHQSLRLHHTLLNTDQQGQTYHYSRITLSVCFQLFLSCVHLKHLFGCLVLGRFLRLFSAWEELTVIITTDRSCLKVQSSCYDSFWANLKQIAMKSATFIVISGACWGV